MLHKYDSMKNKKEEIAWMMLMATKLVLMQRRLVPNKLKSALIPTKTAMRVGLRLSAEIAAKEAMLILISNRRLLCNERYYTAWLVFKRRSDMLLKNSHNSLMMIGRWRL